MQNVRLFALTLGVIAGLCGMRPAAAQPVINGDFYEESIEVNCTGGICLLMFTAPATRVHFSKISCLHFGATSTILHVAFGIFDTPTSPSMRRKEWLDAGPAVTGGNSRTQQTINGVIDFLSAPGKLPSVFIPMISGTGAATLGCKITGRIQA